MSLKKIYTLFFILLFVLASAKADNIIVNMDSHTNITHTKLLGVTGDESGYVGISADLTVETRPGSGRVFMDTLPLTKLDTQASARLAKEVACTTLDVDCSETDFFYTIRSDYSMIGGPSAGSALTAATMAALQGVEMNSDVMITGTINPAGSLGSIGGVYEKAKVAAESKARILVIPAEQEYSYEAEGGEIINFIADIRENYNMTIVFAEDIIDAYKYLTGYQITKPKLTSTDVVSEQLNTVLKTMAEGLISQAQDALAVSTSKIKTAPLDKKADLEELNRLAKEELDNAQKSFSKGLYYSASSFAVRSEINSYYADKMIEYYRTGEDPSYVSTELKKIDNSVSDFEILFLKNKTIDSINDVEVLSVVIDRIREAETIVDNAHESFNQTDYETTLYLCAYAEVRKNTAYQWLTLVNSFTGNTTYVFDPSAIKPLALERIEQSKNSYLYAEFVSSNFLLSQSEELIHDAEKAYNNKHYVFALFEAAKARATANLALEVRTLTNDTVDSKIKHLEESALLSIQKAEDRGLVPILALSYLEFAKSFYDTDPAQALIYLSYSKEMATISYEISQSAFGDMFNLNNQPLLVERYYEEIVRFDAKQEFAITTILLITGIFAGIMMTLYIIEKR